MAGLSDALPIQAIAIPAVSFLIAFLGFFSQYLFYTSTTLEPGPLSRRETITFNILLALLYYTYYKACSVDPGSYSLSPPISSSSKKASYNDNPAAVIEIFNDSCRWCNKCNGPKPPRSHHCRHCARCIPKMDHHCPWTANCVSMTTFPHFLRFLTYANLSLLYFCSLIWHRLLALWHSRNLPAYLGPSMPALASLALLSLVGFFTTVALALMLATTLRSWVANQTLIESWEHERHCAVAERRGSDWWDVTTSDGKPMRFEKVEFPYDVGFFANMAQAMGSANPLCWLNPLAGNPVIGAPPTGSGWKWEENGFNRKEGMWPPPDPDKIRRAARAWPAAKRDFEAELRELDLSPEEQRERFRQRQEADLRRRRRRLVAELEEMEDYAGTDDEEEKGSSNIRPGRGAVRPNMVVKSGWVNSDGDKLRDYGVDEEDTDEEDVPLGEILRRRKTTGKSDDKEL